MKVNLTLPHSWEELSPSQLTYVSSLFLQGLTRKAFLAKAFICLSGLKILPGRYGSGDNTFYLFRNKKRQTFPLSPYELEDFSRDCGFLLQERENFAPLQCLAKRRARNVMMYDACFGEFVAALVYYNQFRDPDKDRIFLDKLCAVMYPSGPWDPENRNHEEFMREPLHVCYTAFLWFGAVMNVVVRECPHLFRESCGESEPVPLRENIHSMYNLVTGNDITKEKEIAGMEMWRVLYDMDEKARRIKEEVEQMQLYGRV